MSSGDKRARFVGAEDTKSEAKHADDQLEEQLEEQEEDQIIRQIKRRRLQYEGIDQNELNQDKLFASPSEKCALEPVIKRAVRDGSLARIFASSPYIFEIVQDAMNYSLLLSKTLKARTMQVTQDASGNSNTELEQLANTICVLKYHRYTDYEGGGDERVGSFFTIGGDPDHSIRFESEQGPHESACYVSFGTTHFSLHYAIPIQYQSMITRWGLIKTRVEEIRPFLEQLGDLLNLRLY